MRGGSQRPRIVPGGRLKELVLIRIKLAWVRGDARPP
jgi:hypothetical protein